MKKRTLALFLCALMLLSACLVSCGGNDAGKDTGKDPSGKTHTEHEWDAGAVTTAPTCGAEGTRTFTCFVCGTTKTETIPKTDAHKWDEGRVTAEATAENDGTRTYTCSVCGETLDEPFALPGTALDFGTLDGGAAYRFTDLNPMIWNGSTSEFAIPSTYNGLPVREIDCNGVHLNRFYDIYIPNTVTVIRNASFADCTKLSRVHWSERLETIGKYAFEHCGLVTLELPASLETIGDYAFRNCSILRNLTLPASLTEIGQSAFMECDALTEVTYTGTMAQWGAIKLETTSFRRGVIIHCTDGDVTI